MSYIVQPDYDTLPTALLPLAKEHMRVTFEDDNTTITEYLAQAIGLLEQFWGLSVFSAEVDWQPTLILGVSRYRCPMQPVSAFTVMTDAINVSSEYALESTSLIEPVWLVHSDGTAFAADAAVTLTTGYDTVASLPPPMRAGILRVAAGLYENRENITPLSLDLVPMWLGDITGGLWIPRA